jgi:hypothetical protein
MGNAFLFDESDNLRTERLLEGNAVLEPSRNSHFGISRKSQIRVRKKDQTTQISVGSLLLLGSA